MYKYFMTTPFTYLVGWPDHGLFYYGVRYRKGCEPSDLWTKYFTSSKYVAETRRTLGEPTLIEVRRTFGSEQEARSWETRVLIKIDAQHHPKFLNRSNLPAYPSEKTPEHIENIAAKLRGQKRTPEQRAKMGPTGKTWTLSEETKQKMSLAKKGVPKPDGFGAAVSARMKCRVQSEEERAKRIAALTGKKKSPEHIAAVVAAKKRKREERLAASQ
jgi:hypothetical protein